MIKAIVAVDENWAIGCSGRLLFALPTDLQHFKRMTKGKTVLMGRKTMDSLPGGRPLPGRLNLVLTNDPARVKEGFFSVSTVEEAVERLTSAQRERLEPGTMSQTVVDDAFVLGGEQVYRLLLPYCDEAIVTHIHERAETADAFFPDLTALSDWEEVERGDTVFDSGHSYTIVCYRRMSQK